MISPLIYDICSFRAGDNFSTSFWDENDVPNHFYGEIVKFLDVAFIGPAALVRTYS